jgi:PAS domain S-box-containing protein
MPDEEPSREVAPDVERARPPASRADEPPDGDDELRVYEELVTYEAELAAQNEELRKAYAALEEERARFQELYADAPIGFFLVGLHARILNCNTRGARFLRLKTNDATRRRLTEFLPPECAQEFTARVAQLYETKVPITFESEIRRSDGKAFWAELTINLARRDSANVCQVIMVDITDRKLMMEDTARLAAIVASSANAILSQDRDGTIRSWNAGAERLFGVASSEAIGGTLTRFVPRDRTEEDLDIMHRIFRRETVALETVRVTADGTHVPVFLSAAPILNTKDRVVGISSIMRDITDQVASRQEVARLLEDLRRTDRRKDEFIATLAHELRNPLAPIRNAVAVMRYTGDLAPKLQWCRELIDRQVGQMAALLEDLLDVSRLTRDKITLRKDRVELSAAIQQAVETNRHLIDARAHRLVVQQAPHAIEVEGDLTRLIQIFGNLLNNAAKYTEPGGQIILTTSVEGGVACIRVRDTGIGIDPDDLRNIFDLFAQVDSAQEGTEGGLGIGLALVKGLVELHGGRIVARSEGTNKGSEFIVSLPLAPKMPATVTGDHAIIPAPNLTTKAVHVLIADDNVDAAESLAMLLQADQHEVRTAHDGEEALLLATEHHPDVIVLDLGMPKLSGYEVARRVRQSEWGRTTMLIACTGWGQPEDRRRSADAGFDHHLVKPVSASAVIRLVRGNERYRAT